MGRLGRLDTDPGCGGVADHATKRSFPTPLAIVGHPLLSLGQTLGGQEFYIEGQDLEKVNVVTGVKGSGKSHLSKVILLQLIEQGCPMFGL